MSTRNGPTIRDSRDADADGLIRLIGACFDEYEGCLLDVDGEMPELRSITTSFEAMRGRFWIAELEGTIVGCVGIAATGVAGTFELKKLYVDARVRKLGLGGVLTALVELDAVRRKGTKLELWSDTRFTTAHAFYAKRGYVKLPETRELHDKSATVEYHFEKVL